MLLSAASKRLFCSLSACLAFSRSVDVLVGDDPAALADRPVRYLDDAFAIDARLQERGLTPGEDREPMRHHLVDGLPDADRPDVVLDDVAQARAGLGDVDEALNRAR